MPQSDLQPSVMRNSISQRFDQRSKAMPMLVRYLTRRLQTAGVSRLHLVLADGRSLTLGSPSAAIPVPTITLYSLRAVVRGWFGGLMGWCEGYIAGDWGCSDPTAVTDWAMANETAIERAFAGGKVSSLLNRLFHRLHDNSRRGSRRNIAFHYDLGNDFYEQWLDRTMTYSAALFDDPNASLEQAQNRKYQRVLELLAPQPGQQVLEVGCGWGGFGDALLSHTDAHWHGVTLSQQQLKWTHRRLADYGERAQATLTDYRDLNQRYDHIVSIEMLEAVGEANWPLYFDRLKALLKPGGRAVIQVITIADERFDSYRQGTDFIQRYIFPGGMLPCPRVMREQIDRAGLTLLHEQSFGLDYARTLAIWARDFQDAWPQIQTLTPTQSKSKGFDQRFYRLWRYYLAYCESGFKVGATDVRFYQISADA